MTVYMLFITITTVVSSCRIISYSVTCISSVLIKIALEFPLPNKNVHRDEANVVLELQLIVNIILFNVHPSVWQFVPKQQASDILVIEETLILYNNLSFLVNPISNMVGLGNGHMQYFLIGQ